MKPLVLVSTRADDADFYYATRMPVEIGFYVRFAEGDDVLLVSTMEKERAQASSTAKQILNFREAGLQPGENPERVAGRLIAGVLRARDQSSVRISPWLPVSYFKQLEAEDVAAEVEQELFVDERRRKSEEEAGFIHGAQRAAEAACVEVIGMLGTADVRDGRLWTEGEPLTSERLMAEANYALNTIGYSCADIIVAGSPGAAMPHFRGEGQINAGAPVIIDIFPRGSTSRYHGDLTRTVVVGDIPDEVRRMHDAVCKALDAAIAAIRPGVNGRDVNAAACQVLVDAGYATAIPGFEGKQDAPSMIHSTGHGVGLAVHEWPVLSTLDMPLREGDVVTVEPGLYQPGLGGVRVEDTGIVTRDGFRNFTSISRSLDPRAYL